MTLAYRASALGAALVALVVSGTAAATAGASPGHHPAAAAKPGSTWTALSSGAGVMPGSSIGLATFGDQIEAVWAEQSGSSNSLVTRTVDGAGQPVGAAVPVVSNWNVLNPFPAIMSINGERLVAFSGLRSTDPNDQYGQGYEYEAESQDGATWTLGAGALSASSGAYGSYGSDAVNAGGASVVVYTQDSGPTVSYHEGSFPAIPATPTDDPTTTSTGGTARFSGVGYDVNSGDTVAVWTSDSGDKGTEGVSEQVIEPALGPVVHAPKSATKSNAGYSSFAPLEQRLQVASPPDGGVFAAYPVGYPVPKKVALWQLGSGHLLVAKAGGAALRVDAAPGNGATLWLIWWDKKSGSINLAHTNDNGIAIVKQCSVALPRHTDTVYDIEGQGVGKKVALFVNAGSSNQSSQQIFSQVVGCGRGKKNHG